MAVSVNRRHFPPIQQPHSRPLAEIDRWLVHFTLHVARDALHPAVVVDDLNVRDRAAVADVCSPRRQRRRAGPVVHRVDAALTGGAASIAGGQQRGEHHDPVERGRAQRHAPGDP